MVLPKQTDVEIPLLEVLVEIGGHGKPKDIYELVTKKFKHTLYFINAISYLSKI